MRGLKAGGWEVADLGVILTPVLYYSVFQVRASNTQPVVVMRFEAATPELLKGYQAEVESVVERAKKLSGIGGRLSATPARPKADS